jgi:hypothetical protein
LYPFGLLIGIGFMFLIAFIKSVNSQPEPNLIFAVTFMIAGATALVWLIMSLRCPLCLGRPAWWVIRHASADEWFVLLIGMSTCPLCNDAPLRTAADLHPDN